MPCSKNTFALNFRDVKHRSKSKVLISRNFLGIQDHEYFLLRLIL